jgi:hypothetical protein
MAVLQPVFSVIEPEGRGGLGVVKAMTKWRAMEAAMFARLVDRLRAFTGLSQLEREYARFQAREATTTTTKVFRWVL